MPPHWVDDHILDGGSVDELPFPPPQGGLGERCYEQLFLHDPDFPLMTEALSGRSLSSKEYISLSTKLAIGLEQCGITKGTKVCFVGENGVDICATAFATMLVGGIVAPLDPAMRAFEYQHMIGLIEPSYLICDEHLLDEVQKALKQFPDMDVQLYTIQPNSVGLKSVVDIIAQGEADNSKLEEFKPVVCESSELCLICGSSGSTGLPKAVQLTNANILFTIALISRTARLMDRMDFIHTSHFFWISGLFMYFACLYLRLRRIIVEDVTELNVLQAIDTYNPVFGLMSPSLINGLVQHPDFNKYDTSSMKFIIAAGSPLQMATADLVKEVWDPNLVVVQGYGLTEISGCYLSPRPDMDLAGVGSPNPGTSIKVVDVETGVNLPPGEEGELCCKTLGLMVGYLKNPEATAEAVDQDGWLHTGDIGRISEQLTVYVTGRMKELMKLDNHQIAPGEIEQLINTVRGVADVAVAGIAISEHSRVPMALVVKAEGADVTEEDIVKCVNENLSDFKQLRGGIVFVDAIPRTTTGKIKRRLLQEIADELYMGDTRLIL